MANSLRDFDLNHDDLVIGNKQLDAMAVGDLGNALNKKYRTAQLSKTGFQISGFAAVVAFVFAAAGPVHDFIKDPTETRENFGANAGHITMAILGLAATGLSGYAFSKYKKYDAAARNLNDAFLMKLKPKTRATAEKASVYPGAIDSLVRRGYIERIEKFEYND